MAFQKRDRFIIDDPSDIKKKRGTNKESVEVYKADLSSDNELDQVFYNGSEEDDKLLRGIGVQLSKSANNFKDESPRTQKLLKGL